MNNVLTFRRLTLIATVMLFLTDVEIVYTQWIQQPSFSTENFYKVAFVDSTTGWIVGGQHLYLTTDGGFTWTANDTVLAGGKAFYASDPQTALFAEWYNRGIRRTTDQGLTWQTIDSGAYTYYDFSFVNGTLIGYAACGLESATDTGIVRKTTNGGADWFTIASIPLGTEGYDFEGISFVDSEQGWAVSYNGLMFHTTNGGLSWAFQDSVGRTEDGSGSHKPMRDVVFTTADSGWAIGGLQGVSVIARTTNGGTTWTGKSPLGPSLQEIVMVDSRTGWMVGQNYEENPFITTDGGITWTGQTTSPLSVYFNSIAMINNYFGWAVSNQGKIYKTVNGGITDVQTIAPFPKEFHLEQNFPNPFNPTTTIRYHLSSTSRITLAVTNILGQRIATLVDGFQLPGEWTARFDATGLTSGIYFYNLSAGNFTETKSMLFLK